MDQICKSLFGPHKSLWAIFCSWDTCLQLINKLSLSLPQLRYNMILYSEKITLHPLVHAAAAAAAKLHQSCPTLCDPIEGSPPGSPVPGILQARTLAAAAAKSLQSCPTLCNPIDVCQPTRFPHPWDSPGKNTGVVAISFSSA